MAKKPKKEKEKFIITADQQRKMDRAARRQVDLERGTFIRGGAHKTDRKDVDERLSRSLSSTEIDELIEEELSNSYDDSYSDLEE